MAEQKDPELTSSHGHTKIATNYRTTNNKKKRKKKTKPTGKDHLQLKI